MEKVFVRCDMLKDSGERRQFETGAVRDIVEGKGRCDLMPLEQVSTLISCYEDRNVGSIITDINLFLETGEAFHIYEAVDIFIKYIMKVDYKTAMLEVAKQYEDGAIKYGEHNWEKGIPVHSYVDSGIRHLLKHTRGDTDEPHDRAFLWNMLGLLWTLDNKPELNDLPINNTLQK
jgi:hypothetical protein